MFDAYHPPPEHRPINVVSIDRNDWKVQVVLNTGEYSFMEAGTPFTSESASLDSEFIVEDLHYRWQRLRRE